MITCRRMSAESRNQALNLLHQFLRTSEHYLKSSSAYGDAGQDALERALDLLVAKPELGFVWIAYDESEPVAVCVVSFAISTSIGAVVAKLDDVFVAGSRQGQGIGSAHLNQLKAELRRIGVRRIDTSVHIDNGNARRFYEKHGFRPLEEERIACIL